MNEHAISLVRESFDLIEPIAQQVGKMFCVDLFEAQPGLRHLFEGDADRQGEHLVPLVGRVVARLDDPAALMPILDDLGGRLARRGVSAMHYEAFGASMLKALYQGLGVAYTAEVEEAWVQVYGELSTRMKQSDAAVPQPV